MKPYSLYCLYNLLLRLNLFQGVRALRRSGAIPVWSGAGLTGTTVSGTASHIFCLFENDRPRFTTGEKRLQSCQLVRILRNWYAFTA